MEFPQFRKYKNGKSFFKIESMSNFIEVQLLGSRFIKYEIEAKILPDRNFIQDMLVDYEKNWDVISADEFNIVYNKI
jgi:hypothetical protein